MGGFCVYGNGCAGKNLPKRNFFQKIFCVAWRGVPDTSGRLRQVKNEGLLKLLTKGRFIYIEAEGKVEAWIDKNNQLRSRILYRVTSFQV